MQKTANLDTLDSLELLLQLKKEENIPIQQIVDEDDNTLLHKAIMFSQLDVVRYLIHHHPILCNVKNSFNAYPIHLAVVKNEMPILRLVSKNSKKCVNKRDIYGYTPAQYAAVSGQYETLKYLLDYSYAKPNKLTKKGKLNLLHLGVQSGSLDVVQYLLMKMGLGCLKNRTADGATVYHLAAAKGHDEILEYLLALKPAKYVKNYKDITGSSCFHDAAENGHHKCLKLLFDSGMDIFEPDYESITPYQLAITSKNEECVNFAKNIKLLVSENNFLKENVKLINDFDAANIVTQNLNLKKISLKRLGSMLRLRRAKDVNQDQAYLYTQRFRPAPVSLPQSSKISSIQSNPPLLMSENEDDLCDSAIEELINHVHTNLLRTKQDACININGNKKNTNEDLDGQKRKIIANTSNHVKYARKMDRERIETSLGLILKNSLSTSTTPTLKQLTQSQIAAAAAAAANNNTSTFVKNYVTTKRFDQKQNRKEDDLNSTRSDDENSKYNKNKNESNNENSIIKEIKIENLNDKSETNINNQHQTRSIEKRRCNSYNLNNQKNDYQLEKMIDPTMNSHPNHLTTNLDNRFKRYSFSYLCKSDLDDPLADISQQQHFRSSSLNRNLLNAEHIKIFLKYNNQNNKHIDTNLLNEYLIYNKYLSENNLLAKSVPYLWSKPNQNDRTDLTSQINNKTMNYRINEVNNKNNIKSSRDLLGNNILFEHIVNSNQGINKGQNYDGDDDDDDPDEEVLNNDMMNSYANGKFSKSIPNISNIRTKKNILEASIMPFYETKLLNNLSTNNSNNMKNNNNNSQNICILRESFRIQNKTSNSPNQQQSFRSTTQQARHSQTNISISSFNIGDQAANLDIPQRRSFSRTNNEPNYVNLDTTNSSANYFNNINSNLDEKKEYYNDNKADSFFKIEENSKKSDCSSAIYANSSSNSDTSETTPTNDLDNNNNNNNSQNEMITSTQSIMMIPPPPPQLDSSTTLSRSLNQKLSITNNNINTLNANKAFINIDSESLLNAKQNLKSVKSAPSNESSTQIPSSSSNGEKTSTEFNSNSLQASSTPMSLFLSNKTNAKKNDRLLHEIKNHRLYNMKKDYVLDYLDRNNSSNNNNNNSTNNSNNSSSSMNNSAKLNPTESTVSIEPPNITRYQFSKSNTNKNSNTQSNNKIYVINGSNLKNQEKTISISASTSSTSSISLSSASSTCSTSENGQSVKKNISNTLSISNSNISPNNKFNSCSRTDKIAFCSTLQHQPQKLRVLNQNEILSNNGLSTYRSGRSSSNVPSSKTSSSSSDNPSEVIVGVELIEASDEKIISKTSYISEKINYFRNMNTVVARNVNENNSNTNRKKEIINDNTNSLNSSKLKKIIPEEKYESELDMVFKKRALLLQNS